MPTLAYCKRVMTTVSIFAFLALPTPSNPGQESQALQKLQCVFVLAGISEAASSFGINGSLMQEAAIVSLKAKLPRLRIEKAVGRGCGAVFVNLNVKRDGTASGRTLGYSGSLTLQLWRSAVLIDTGTPVLASVWEESVILSGPSEGASQFILGAMDPLFLKFAASYYEAGNP